MTSARLPGYLCLALLCTLAACDSNDSGDDGGGSGTGTFSAAVTGHTSTTLSGVAVAAGSGGQGGWGIVLGLSTTERITLTRINGDRPGTGSYDIADAFTATANQDQTLFYVSTALGSGLANYTSRAGTLTLTTSTPTRVAGSFQYTAERFAGETIEVSGTFDATNSGS